MKRLILISASFIIGSSAFAQEKCVTAPVNINGSQVTLTSSGNKSVTKDNVYIYYAKKRGKKHDREYPVAAIRERYPSNPLLLNSGKQVASLPETYNVSVSSPQSNVAVCPDSALNVETDISLERVSSYTGNYPNSDKMTYRKVTRREYKMASRKMCKIKKNEAKIARKTGLDVQAKSDNAM